MEITFPVYEFRPLPEFFAGEFRRYANGLWTPDDGEYDLAFIGYARSGFGAYPCCLMVELPYQKNLVCSWLTSHWSGRVAGHPNGNAWHYALRNGETEWGGDWGRDRHENYIAGRRGMDRKCSESGCSNGRHVEFHFNDEHIAAGLLRNRETKEVFVWPPNLTCMYCGHTPQDEAGFRRGQIQKRIANLEQQLIVARNELAATPEQATVGLVPVGSQPR